MNHLFLLIIFSILFFTATAQQSSNTISGVVKDAQNDFFPGASVLLLKAGDSTKVQGIATDVQGRFEFKNLQNGTYLIGVSSVGNKKYTSIPLTLDESHPQVAFPVIVLVPATTLLNEVVTVAKRSLIVQDIDKTVVHVDAMIGSAGSNTLEVLEKTPGVTVGTEGEINLNGKGEVLVLIDNRPTYLSRADLALYLKSLPGGAIDKIELLSNPPAKYDAAGNSIINIVLKKNKLAGLTGNIAAGVSQGFTSRINNVLNLNFKQNKINLFATAAYNKDGNYAKDVYDRRFYTESNALNSQVHLQSDYRYTSSGIMARLGMDYAVSANSVYGFSVNFQDRPRRDKLAYISNSYNAQGTLDSTGIGYTNGTYDWKNLGANFNYQHKFNKKGREISADLDYIWYTSYGRQVLPNHVLLPDGTPVSNTEFLYLLPSSISIYTAKADYQHPLKNKAKLELGVKSSIITNDNKSEYYKVTENTSTLDYGQSNHFIYHENINAAYINARKDWKRIAVQMGVRMENTRARGKQLGNAEVEGSTFEKSYTDIFPTLALRYKIDSTGNNALNLSISRRINRPNYHQLNPFLFYRDNYSYTSGNPLINPQYNYSAEFKYQHKQLLNVGVRYGYFRNLIFSTTQATEEIFVTRPENIANGQNISLTANLFLSPAKWWNLNANVALAHLALRGGIYTESLNSAVNVARINVSNQFKFSNGWSTELSGFYASKDMAGQRVIGQRYRVNAALQKEFLQHKATVRLIADDIFHSWIQKDVTLSLQRAASFHTNETDTQRVGLAFTYRFGKEKFARKYKHQSNAADDEKGRVEE